MESPDGPDDPEVTDVTDVTELPDSPRGLPQKYVNLPTIPIISSAQPAESTALAQVSDPYLIRNSNGGRDFRLQEHQLEHFERIRQTWGRTVSSIDVSPMGSGKNMVLIGLALYYNLPVLAICPKSAIPVWKKNLAKWQVPTYSGNSSNSSLLVRLPPYPKKLRTFTPESIQRYEQEMKIFNDFNVDNIILTYGKLRSKAGSRPTHGLLVRADAGADVLKTGFNVTERFQQLLSNGLIMAFDEMHNIKNKSTQFEACRSLTIACLRASNNKSRIAFLSGTPFDKEEHALNILRLIGFIRQAKLNSTGNAGIILQGASDLVKICQQLDYTTTQQIFSTMQPRSNKDVKDLCYRLFVHVIKPSIISKMPRPVIPAELDVANGYYRMQQDDENRLQTAVAQLSNVSHFRAETSDYDSKQANQGAIMSQLQQIEVLKVPILIRLTTEKLLENPYNKVIIYITFHETVRLLLGNLAQFSPMVINGEVSKQSVRDQIFHNFQTSPNHRLLIMALRAGAESITLADKDGRFPRTMFIVPNHELLRLLQAVYRIYRIGTRSRATVRFIFGKKSLVEYSILQALIKKRTVLHDIIGDDDTITEYPNIFEE